MLGDNLRSLDELNSLPLTITISRLDDGTGIEETLKLHKAKWHKTCYVMCNKTNVDRARKKVIRGECSSPLINRLLGAFSCTSQSDENYSRACFVIPWLTTIFTKLLPSNLMLMYARWPQNLMTPTYW